MNDNKTETLNFINPLGNVAEQPPSGQNENEPLKKAFGDLLNDMPLNMVDKAELKFKNGTPINFMPILKEVESSQLSTSKMRVESYHRLLSFPINFYEYE